MMNGAMQQIGANSNRMNQQIDYNSARHGTAGSGIDAAGRMDVGKATNSAINQANQQAGTAQMQQDNITREKLDNVMMMKERILSETKRRNRIAEDNWKQNMLGTAIETGAGMVASGIQSSIDKKAALSKGYGAAKAQFEATNPNKSFMSMEEFSFGADKYGGAENYMNFMNGQQAHNQGNNYIQAMVDQPEAQEIFASMEKNEINQQQAQSLLATFLKKQKPNTTEIYKYKSDGSYTVSEQENLPNDGIADNISKIYDKSSMQKTKWVAQGNQNLEYVLQGGNYVPSGRSVPREQATKTKDRGKLEKSRFNLSSDIGYRKKQGIGDQTKLLDLEKLTVDGVGEVEISNASNLINDYVFSLTEDDLEKLGADESTNVTRIVLESGGKISKLEAYRFSVAEKLKQSFGGFIEYNFNAAQALDNY